MIIMYEVFNKLYLIYLRWVCEHKDLVFISEDEVALDKSIIHNHKWVCKRCGKLILKSHIHNNHIKKK